MPADSLVSPYYRRRYRQSVTRFSGLFRFNDTSSCSDSSDRTHCGVFFKHRELGGYLDRLKGALVWYSAQSLGWELVRFHIYTDELGVFDECVPVVGSRELRTQGVHCQLEGIHATHRTALEIRHSLYTAHSRYTRIHLSELEVRTAPTLLGAKHEIVKGYRV